MMSYEMKIDRLMVKAILTEAGLFRMNMTDPKVFIDYNKTQKHAVNIYQHDKRVGGNLSGRGHDKGFNLV